MLNFLPHFTRYMDSEEQQHSPTKQLDPAQLKIVDEFQYLLDKSQQLFGSLRDLPPTASHKHWQPYFQKTFEIYTKLWKFQQQNRPILESKDVYGLKRWEIGEIASKIGQLYYHYYLRTSETNYLFESHVFYDAIRERDYFRAIAPSVSGSQASIPMIPTSTNSLGPVGSTAGSPALVVKKLRYLARFCVVCLLLNKHAMVRALLDELQTTVDLYAQLIGKPLDAPEMSEWAVVSSELAAFLEADNRALPCYADSGKLREIERRVPPSKLSKPTLAIGVKVREIVIVASGRNQVKFSELTLDMYRMLQAFEYEPSPGWKPNQPASDAKPESPVEPSMKRVNPHKYLLFRPTLSQLWTYLSTAFNNLGESQDSAMAFYVSADGWKDEEASFASPYAAGLHLNNVKSPQSPVSANSTPLRTCLFASDLVTFTRQPLFLIIESDMPSAFEHITSVFQRPLVCLLSPPQPVPHAPDSRQVGSLFTLFLHSSILGYCTLCRFKSLDDERWNQIVMTCTLIDLQIQRQLEQMDNELDPSIRAFMADDFTRLIFIRFIFCHYALMSETGDEKVSIVSNLMGFNPVSFFQSVYQRYLTSCCGLLKLVNSLHICGHHFSCSTSAAFCAIDFLSKLLGFLLPSPSFQS